MHQRVNSLDDLIFVEEPILRLLASELGPRCRLPIIETMETAQGLSDEHSGTIVTESETKAEGLRAVTYL